MDKENGKSKADASNAGINISSYPYLLCADVDCIIHKDALLKLIKPFIEDKTRVIACGATIRVANSCEIDNGFLIKARIPTQFLPLFQELEYIRAFLLGRMAWSKINALMLVSGALGMFDKEIVLQVGGFDNKSFGEDMELVTRMRRYMHDINVPYKVKYIPESLCWTEVPASLRVFGIQRTRWSRGLAQNSMCRTRRNLVEDGQQLGAEVQYAGSPVRYRIGRLANQPVGKQRVRRHRAQQRHRDRHLAHALGQQLHVLLLQRIHAGGLKRAQVRKLVRQPLVDADADGVRP